MRISSRGSLSVNGERSESILEIFWKYFLRTRIFRQHSSEAEDILRIFLKSVIFY